MSVSFFSLYLIFLLLVGGGETSLRSTVNPEVYWERHGVAYEAEAMRRVLTGGDAEREDQIRMRIQQLGAETHAEREAAEEALKAMGSAARRPLEAAVKHKDPEIARRVRRLLESLPLTSMKEDESRLMAILSLGRMRDEGAVKLLKQIAAEGEELERREAEWALKEIQGGKEEEVPEEEPVGAVLNRFPASTDGFFHVSLRPRKSGLLEEVRGSPMLQEMLGSVYVQTGEVRLRSLTAGSSKVWNLEEGGGTMAVWIRMDHDPVRFARYLVKAGRFQVEETEIGVYLHQGPLFVVPVSGEELLFFVHDGMDPAALWGEATSFFERRDTPLWSADLAALVSEVDTEVDMWTAALLPETFDDDVKEIEVFDTLTGGGVFGEKGLEYELRFAGGEPEEVEEVVASRRSTRDEIIQDIAQGHGAAAAALEAMKSMAFETDGGSAVYRGLFPESLLKIQLRQYEQMRSRMRRHQRPPVIH